MPSPNCKLPDPVSLFQDLADEDVPAYIRKAGDFLACGDAKSCIQHLNRSPVKEVVSPWGWIVAATAHCQTGNPKMAVGVATRGLQYAGENSYLFDCLGVAYAGLGDLAAAQNYFQKAIKANPRNGNSIVNLANVHLARSAVDSAFAVIEQGLQENPGHSEIRHLYIQLHPLWVAPLENGKIRIRVRAPQDDSFVKHCYENEAFMNNYNRYLADSFRRSRTAPDSDLRNRLSVYNNKCVQWVIERADPAKPEQPGYLPIGLASLAEIQLTHRRAEILLGFPDARLNGSGIPLAAMLMILDFAFNTIGFSKLTSIVYAGNAHAQKSSLALGFKQEGFFRKHLFDHKHKVWLDTYQNAILIEELRDNIRIARFSERLINRQLAQVQPALFGRFDPAS